MAGVLRATSLPDPYHSGEKRNYYAEGRMRRASLIWLIFGSTMVLHCGSKLLPSISAIIWKRPTTSAQEKAVSKSACWVAFYAFPASSIPTSKPSWLRIQVPTLDWVILLNSKILRFHTLSFIIRFIIQQILLRNYNYLPVSRPKTTTR